MNILYFLQQRTKFIRFFYEISSKPFIEIKSSIEEEKEPFVPIYREEGEPQFLEEWQSADHGVETVGHTCISMLSSSLKLFFLAWVNRIEREHGIKIEIDFRKNGWFHGFLKLFSDLKIPLEIFKDDLIIIEQVALARNRVQHPEDLTTILVDHSARDLTKYPNPFFTNDAEIRSGLYKSDDDDKWWIKPTISSTKDKIFHSIDLVERFCKYLDDHYLKRSA